VAGVATDGAWEDTLASIDAQTSRPSIVVAALPSGQPVPAAVSSRAGSVLLAVDDSEHTCDLLRAARAKAETADGWSTSVVLEPGTVIDSRFFETALGVDLDFGEGYTVAARNQTTWARNSCRVHWPRIAALIAAHNEEAVIGRTIWSLVRQTYPVSHIIVSTDNCTDQTIPISLDIAATCPQVRVLKTVDNRAKKAGALNQAFAYLESIDQDIDFIVQMDGDSTVAEDYVELGVEEFEQNDDLGGLGARLRLFVPGEESSRWSRSLWRMQNLEYSLFTPYLLERQGDIQVITGVASMFRMSVLQEVRRRRGDGLIWDQESIVEDYVLTLDLKEAGYRASVRLDMWAWTDFMPSVGALYRQRMRWYGGTAEVLRQRGWNKTTRDVILGQIIAIAQLIPQYLWFPLIIASVVIGWGWSVQWWLLTLTGFCWAAHCYRVKRYANDLDIPGRIIAYGMWPFQIYQMFRDSVLAFAVLRSFRRRSSTW
jgi:glycosyltransferase involved in cell wall biosynthesis